MDQNRIRVDRKEQETLYLPLDTLDALILDTPQVVLTHALLSTLTSKGIALVTTDEQHLPSGVLLPQFQHCRNLATLKLQLGWSDEFKRRLRQHIIRQKLANQAEALRLVGAQAALINRLKRLSEKVRAGDPDNLEGQGAQLYHRHILQGGSRHDDLFFNHAINYGFAIIRALLAKYLTAYGFHPSLGIFHHSTLNAFNLADDLIEPYRPYVELWALQLGEQGTTEFGTPHKAHLLRLPQLECVIDKKRHTLLYALELSVKSLVSASRAKRFKQLLLPEIHAMPQIKELA